MLEVVFAYLRSVGRHDQPNSATEARNGSLRGFSQICLQFAERLFDRIEVGRIRRQITQFCSNSFDGVPNTRDLVRGKIVHDDDIATIQGRSQTLLDIGNEGRPVHRAINYERRNHAIIAQASHESDRFPMPVRRVAVQSRAPQTTASQPNHLGGCGSLVNKHQPGRLKHALLSMPALSRAGHVRPVLLRGAQAFF